MRICVAIPNAAFQESAGTRIRYLRLRTELEKRHHSLDLRLLQDIRKQEDFIYDAYIISKCYDARSIALAAVAASKGQLVGVDLFDDYFSQGEDARFLLLRSWLRRLSPNLDFALCSTPRMQTVVTSYIRNRPVHVLNDPFEGIDVQAIAKSYAQVVEQALASRRIEIGWFGAGDSPHFPVGLHDLLAFSDTCMELRALGYEPRLSVMTGARSLSTDGLEMLRRLPVPCSVDEWSTEGERALVARSLFCFIPVNAQRFSVAKSMNRAVTALTGGSQVLSVGFPLYERLGEFVYRDVRALMRDIEARRPAVRADTLHAFTAHLATLADPAKEATRFADFLTGLVAARKGITSSEAPRLALLHGRRSPGDVHKYAQSIGILSIGTPVSNPSLNYDISFAMTDDGGALEARLTSAAATHLPDAWQKRCEPLPQPDGKRTLRVPAFETGVFVSPITAAAAAGSAACAIALYEAQMQASAAAMAKLLPNVQLIPSETDACFWAHLDGVAT